MRALAFAIVLAMVVDPARDRIFAYVPDAPTVFPETRASSSRENIESRYRSCVAAAKYPNNPALSSNEIYCRCIADTLSVHETLADSKALTSISERQLPDHEDLAPSDLPTIYYRVIDACDNLAFYR